MNFRDTRERADVFRIHLDRGGYRADMFRVLLLSRPKLTSFDREQFNRLRQGLMPLNQALQALIDGHASIMNGSSL